MSIAAVAVAFLAGSAVGFGIALADYQRLQKRYRVAVEVCERALHFMIDEFPAEHGSERIGRVWQGLHAVVYGAREDQS